MAWARIAQGKGGPGKTMVLLGRGGARERLEFLPLAKTEESGLCDDEADRVCEILRGSPAGGSRLGRSLARIESMSETEGVTFC
ncbi:hypothetical protein CE91St43_29330 [Oscillospiraceae bacterium]|nr:hypothetical protein CE91St43_29330 [Oscillospiraceae bacterium]